MRAVTKADDRPLYPDSMGRLMYLYHLGVVLWWLLDRSPDQRVTERLVRWMGSVAPMVATVLWLPGVSEMVVQLDGMYREGLLGEEE